MACRLLVDQVSAAYGFDLAVGVKGLRELVEEFGALPPPVAEELGVDFQRIRTRQGSPSLAAVAPVGSSIPTAGSSVTRTNFWKLRDAAATAR